MLSIADAHQQDPQAIAEIIRQELQVLGAERFDIDIAVVDSSLDLQLRTNSTIDREQFLTLLRTQLPNLRLESVAKVRVRCWRNDEETHEQHLLWTEQLMLESLISSPSQAVEITTGARGAAELPISENRSSELAESPSTEVQLSKHSVLQKAISKLASDSPKAKIHLQTTQSSALALSDGQNAQSPHHQENLPITKEKYYGQLLLVGLAIVLLGLGIGAFFRSITIKNTVDSAPSISSGDLPSNKSANQNPQTSQNLKDQDSDRLAKSSETPIKPNRNISSDKSSSTSQNKSQNQIVIPSADNADLSNNPTNANPNPTIPLSNNPPSEEKLITLEKFNLVQKGMTIEQVDKIFGISGKVIAENTTNDSIGKVYSWKNPQGSNAIIEFKDGQVVAKAQAGL